MQGDCLEEFLDKLFNLSPRLELLEPEIDREYLDPLIAERQALEAPIFQR
jgi:hypothetical protein